MKQSKVRVVDHPLIQHKLTLMRDRETSSKDFRDLLEEISLLMAFEITRNLPTEKVPVRTPLEKTTGPQISGKALAVVAVLRAGLGMIGGMMQLVPKAKVGYIGLFRDHKTLQAVQYYQKLPTDLSHRFVILADPMLATGNSAVKAAGLLKDAGAKNIALMCLLAAPEGIRQFSRKHPDVSIYTAAIDRKLNAKGYILPGLGDAGDRLFGTL